eukprot:3421539-Pyramimonas_sp.AAC.1
MAFPQDIGPLVRHCQVLPRLGAKLQAMKGTPPKDHVPIHCCIECRKYGVPNLAETEAGIVKWDHTKMMEAVRTGAGREPFLTGVRAAMQTLPIHSYIDWDSPDTIFEGIEK